MARKKNGISSLRTVGAFLNGRACSNTLFNVLSLAFGNPMQPEEGAAMPLAGGIMQHGYQCGMIWGASLAAGARAYHKFGRSSQAEAAAIVAAQRLVKSFHENNGAINCLEITDIDKSSSSWQMIKYFLIKGGSIGCMNMAAKYAHIAFNEIDAALADTHNETLAPPVSCAALLARRMGTSDRHAVMVAGFAGGIGLCGGACGALGAAIWLTSLKTLKSKDGKIDFKDPEAVATIDRFLKCTDYKFECSAIVGRKFESVEDHACHVCSGGCAEIIEALAPMAERRLQAV